MLCPSCGVALEQQLKFCNRCGSQLPSTKEAGAIELFEKRMDSEMEGLFWITVFGIALILGGIVLMKKVGLSEWLIFAYMILSSAAFVTYFGLGVWQVRRLAKISKEAHGVVQPGQLDTNELNPAAARTLLGSPAPSVTEHTTRTLEPISKKQIT